MIGTYLFEFFVSFLDGYPVIRYKYKWFYFKKSFFKKAGGGGYGKF
jgi:hypothetical protein